MCGVGDNGCRLVFARSNNRYTVLTHQSVHAAKADIQADVFQIFRHPWATTLGTLLRNTLPCSAVHSQSPLLQ